MLSTVLVACSQERSLAPKPTQYFLYALVGTLGGNIGLDIIDGETDTLSGHIEKLGHPATWFIAATQDGRYLVSLAPGIEIGLYRLPDCSPVGVVSTIGMQMAIDSRLGRIFASTSDSTYVYRIPELALDTVWNRGFNSHYTFLVIPETDRLLGVVRVKDNSGITHDEFVVMDCQSGAVVERFTLHSPLGNSEFLSMEIVASPKGKRLFCLAVDNAGACLIGFDLAHKTPLFRRELETLIGHGSLSPDGSEFWLTQSFPGLYPDPPPPGRGYVLIVDAATGAPIDTIRTLGLRADRPSRPLPIMDIRFIPNNPKAYVSSYMSSPSILAVSTDRHEVTGRLFVDTFTVVNGIEVIPR